MINILGIETSCDDSSAAIVSDGVLIRSNVVANQELYHRKFGGIVPEIAARKHLEHLLPVVIHCLDEAKMSLSDIDAISVTRRPGLIGSLVVGLTAAKSLSLITEKPLIGIHHIEAHAYAACLAGLQYGTPHVSLVASGGHTSILYIRENGEMQLWGQTVDDAAGEAFDKVSKLLGFGYPGGPVIDKLAAESVDPDFEFPRPMKNSPGFNFSFSGLKTAVMYHYKLYPNTPPAHIASAFQSAVIDVLLSKTIAAARQAGVSTVAVVGGVAANSGLRTAFTEYCNREGFNLFIPPPRLCTDNAAMVAGLGYQKFIRNQLDGLEIGANSNAGMVLFSTPDST